MKRIMSLVIKSLVAILAAGGTFATGLHAQSEPAMTVNIPFPFTVDTQTIAPGTYQFSLGPNPFQLSIVDIKSGHTKLFAVRPEQERAIGPHGHVDFQKRNEDRVLNEVHFSGTGMFIHVIQPRSAGRAEAKRSLPGDSVSVAQR